MQINAAGFNFRRFSCGVHYLFRIRSQGELRDELWQSNYRAWSAGLHRHQRAIAALRTTRATNRPARVVLKHEHQAQRHGIGSLMRQRALSYLPALGVIAIRQIAHCY
jgi:hypothetical protein